MKRSKEAGWVKLTKKKRKGREKEAGKVIVKKKARISPSIRTKKVRWDIVVVAVIVVFIAVGVVYLVTHASRESSQQVKPATENLYRALEEIYFTNRPNPNATLDVFYDVRGNVSINGTVFGVKDFMQFRIFFYNRTLKVPSNENGTSGNKTVVLSGHGVIPLGAYYVQPVLDVLGFTSKVENISMLLVNVENLRNHNVSIKTEYLSHDKVTIPTVKEPLDTVKIQYTYTIDIHNKTYHVNATVWYETKYKFPVKAVVNINECVLTFKLEYAELTYLSQQRV